MITRQRYRAILEELPDATRVIFLLHRADGLDYRPIAALRGIAVVDVECHMAEAIALIAERLDQYQGREP